jgi:hypothetical protein
VAAVRQLAYRRIEQLAVEFIAHGRHVAACLRTEDFAAGVFPNSRIDFKTALSQNSLFTAALRCARILMFTPIHQQIAVGLISISSNPSTELMELGQPVAVSIVDENCVRIWNVESTLDDGGREENICDARQNRA